MWDMVSPFDSGLQERFQGLFKEQATQAIAWSTKLSGRSNKKRKKNVLLAVSQLILNSNRFESVNRKAVGSKEVSRLCENMFSNWSYRCMTERGDIFV